MLLVCVLTWRGRDCHYCCCCPQDEAVPLEPGQELLIAYRGGYTPVEAFLKFGFVADEWW